MDPEYNFYMKTDMSSYIGEWVAICNEEVVAHGPSFKRVFRAAKQKYPRKRPLVTRVPDKDTMIF